MTVTFKCTEHPMAIVRRFNGRRGIFFLDSSLQSRDARFSYFGFDPFATVSGKSFDHLRKVFKKYARPMGQGLAYGGAVGYIGYEGNFHFGFYEYVCTVDHLQKTVSITGPKRSMIDAIADCIKNQHTSVARMCPLKNPLDFKSNFTKALFEQAVRKALGHIKAGDIYQINLSRRVELRINDWQKHTDAMTIYAALRDHSPSPFAAYYDDGIRTILSSSPERFLKLENGIAQIKPMKGTRPRGRIVVEDQKLLKELSCSSKEIAELLMVTDLERNDLGRVCAYGSVRVRKMRTIEKYKNVFQATATIEGQLHPRKDAFDLMAATFPGGSVTGCPKIEAMKTIQQIEKIPRGLYTGALGYMAFDGSMDFSVLIRSIFLRKNVISFHVGSGIVADSNPCDEYEETKVKATAMVKALEEAFGA